LLSGVNWSERQRVGQLTWWNWIEICASLPMCVSGENWSMDAQIRTLKADIAADLKAIANIYAAINRYSTVPT